METNDELKMEMLNQHDWQMNPLSFRFPCNVSKEIYLKMYLITLKHKKACAESEAKMYGEFLTLLKE
jgi:hypothetical protein